MPLRLIQVCLTALLILVAAVPVMALDDAHWQTANESIERGIAYLRGTQNEDGSWSPQAGPAVTAMVLGVLLDRPDIAGDDPAVRKAIEYVMSKRQADGGIHDGILENYNTSICLAALARINDRPDVAEAIAKGQAYLRGLQWHDQADPSGEKIGQGHAYYGGAGYGKHGRPDMSNTQMMLEGLYESGMDCNDPIFRRALAFITRCQGTAANHEFGDQIVPDGGFIYATSVNKEQIGVPQSQAGYAEQEPVAGRAAPRRLRTYGSMTYAGFKSYIYANLDRDDPRVLDAYRWIKNNYTLDHNPGMPEDQKLQGLYYYYMTFGRALRAWGVTTIPTPDGQHHDWANDLITKLAELQREDGSWINEADRWMEGDADLVTAYALIALTQAVR